MDAFFHSKSRTCITRFIQASQLNATKSRANVLCDPARFAAGRSAADAYFRAQKKCSEARRQEKIGRILKRMATGHRAALTVAEVSLASAMQAPLLERIARSHINAAEGYVAQHQWFLVEEELRVVQALYGAQGDGGVAPSPFIHDGVATVRDHASVARCEEALAAARSSQHHGHLFTARRHIHAVTHHVGKALAHVSQETRDQLEHLRESALSLRRYATVAQEIDEACERLARAESRGDLREIFNQAAALHDRLQRMPEDLPCRTAAGVLTGLRHWDARASRMRVFAAMLEEARGHNLEERATVEDVIRALGCLEGPARDYGLVAGMQKLNVCTDDATYAHASMKARVAATLPDFPSDRRLILRLGAQRMYFHSGNYKMTASLSLGDLVQAAPDTFIDYYRQAHTAAAKQLFFESLGFVCTEAQLAALLQAHLDPLAEDMSDKHTAMQRCDEHLRVFRLKQIRAYAATNGLNPIGHANDIVMRADFDAKYFNRRTFVDYLRARDFTKTVSAKELDDLMEYEINEVCVLSA